MQVFAKKVIPLFTAYNNNSNSFYKFKHNYTVLIKQNANNICWIVLSVLFKFASK